MRKATALLCALVITVSLSACAKGIGQDVSSEVSMPIPSQGLESIESTQSKAESSESSGGQSGGGQSGGSQSGGESAASASAKVYSAKAEANLNTGSYQVKTSEYNYKKDNLDYYASYPQLSGKISNSGKINTALETCAMQTIRSMGTAKKAQRASVRSTGDVTYEGKNFLSVGFNEYVKLSPSAQTSHGMRTANFDLKTGAVITFNDMITKSDAFYQALEAAGKTQLTSEQAAGATSSAIKSGLDPNVIYFTDSGVGFFVQLTIPEKRPVRITLDYTAAKPFMTKNANWSNFI